MDEKFQETVRNLLNMKPKPHDEASASCKGQPSADQSSSKRATKLRNSDES